MTNALQIMISESKSSVLDKEHNQGSKIPHITSEVPIIKAYMDKYLKICNSILGKGVPRKQISKTCLSE